MRSVVTLGGAYREVLRKTPSPPAEDAKCPCVRPGLEKRAGYADVCLEV